MNTVSEMINQDDFDFDIVEVMTNEERLKIQKQITDLQITKKDNEQRIKDLICKNKKINENNLFLTERNQTLMEQNTIVNEEKDQIHDENEMLRKTIEKLSSKIEDLINHNTDLEKRCLRYKKEKNDEKQIFEKKIKDLNEKHENNVQCLINNHNQEIKNYTDENKKLITKNKINVQNLNKKHTKEIETLKQKYDEKNVLNKKEIDEIGKKCMKEILRVNDQKKLLKKAIIKTCEIYNPNFISDTFENKFKHLSSEVIKMLKQG